MDLVAGKKLEPRTYELISTRAVDGDSIAGDLVVELADVLLRVRTRIYVSVHIRLLGIDAPEMVGASSSEGLRSKTRMAELLFGAAATATVFNRDKYGRLLGNVSAAGVDVAGVMLAEGLAKPSTYRGESHEAIALWSGDSGGVVLGSGPVWHE